MAWWTGLLKRFLNSRSVPENVPLPVLVHSHPKDAVPPGPLEDGILEFEQDDVVLHALAGMVQADGTLGELPLDKLDWACRLSYRHLKREGALLEYGIPTIPAYEEDAE